MTASSLPGSTQLARVRPAAFLGALLLAFGGEGCEGCDSAAKDPPPSTEAPPPAPSTPFDPGARPGPWASDVPPAANASAETARDASASAEVPSRDVAGAAHILVAYKGALDAPKTVTRSKELAKKRAEEALQKLRDKKATFEELVRDYSDDLPSKPAAGAIGNFERYAMPRPFADATFNLAVGETSDVVETPRGFHIIRRTK